MMTRENRRDLTNSVFDIPWADVARAGRLVRQTLETQAKPPREIDKVLAENWVVLIVCDDEADQREKLRWCKENGMTRKAVIS